MIFSKYLSVAALAGIVAAAPAPASAPAISRRDLEDPRDPDISKDQQCSWFHEDIFFTYNVVINNAKAYTDDECGSGFLDNVRGPSCSVTGWTCHYATDGKTMNANFNVPLGCGPSSVEGAIYKAFGQLEGVSCKEYK